MDSTKVIIGSKKFPVTFSYANVFTPKAVQKGGKEKFSVSLIISKDDQETVNKVLAAIALAAEQGKSKFKGGKVPAKFKNPLRDGDEEHPDDENYENAYFIGANSDRKPGIVDINLDELMDQDEFYSGCKGRATVNFYAFEQQGGGVAAGLGNLQKLDDGVRLGGGGASAKDDFGDDEDLF